MQAQQTQRIYSGSVPTLHLHLLPNPYLRIQSTKKILKIQHVRQPRPLLLKQEHLFFEYKPILNNLILRSDQPNQVLKPLKTQKPKIQCEKNKVQKF